MVTIAAAPARTLADALLPRYALLRDAVLVVLGSLLTAACAQLRIELGPVPITAQTLVVLLVGAALGSRRGPLAMLAYLGEGMAGLPVFVGGANAWSPGRAPGLPYIANTTAGYLVGFVVAALVVGWMAERGWDRRPWRAAVAMLAGNLAIYACGAAWLSRFVGVQQAVLLGVVPFLLGDGLKLVLAAALLPVAWALVGARASSSR